MPTFFLTDCSPVWRVIAEGKMDLIRFRLTIKNSNFLFVFGPKKKKEERNAGLQNRYDRSSFMLPVVQ